MPVIVVGAVVVALAATVAAAPDLQPRKVTYNFSATFGVGLTETWSIDEGDRNRPCSSWTHSQGRNEVNGGSSRDLRGGIQIFPPGRRGRPKVAMWAVGAGRATIERTLTETGGASWTPSCGNARPAPFRAPPNDCGERQYSTRLAAIKSERRNGKGDEHDWTLEDWVAPSPNGREVLSITLQPITPVFRTCRTGPALEYPVNIGLLIGDEDVQKLRALRAGGRHRIELPVYQFAGDCVRNLPDAQTCRYRLDAHVDIRRLRP